MSAVTVHYELLDRIHTTFVPSLCAWTSGQSHASWKPPASNWTTMNQ